jgi:hypothetical protein
MGGYCEDFYDTKRGIYFREDSDFGFRLEDAGASIMVDPAIRVTHPFEHPGLLDPIHWARRYEMDVLLERRHPERFHDRIEVAQLGPLRFRRMVLRASAAYVATLAASTVALGFGEKGLAALFAGAAVILLVPIWAKWRFHPMRFPIVLVIPFVLVASYARGFGYARERMSRERQG